MICNSEKSANVWLCLPDKCLKQQQQQQKNLFFQTSDWLIVSALFRDATLFLLTPHCVVFYLITLCVYLYHRLYIKTTYRDCYIQSMTCTHKLLKATGAPAALLPFLPQPSEQQLFFCSVVCRCLTGEGGQGGAAGWGAEPQAEQPAAAGGVTEHGGPSHQSHRAAVQRQQALLASPPHVRARTEISRVMQIVQCGFFTLDTFTLFWHILKTHTHTYPL